MKIQRLLFTMCGMLLVSFGGVLAQTDPPQDPNPLSGKDRAIDAIEVNLARQIAHLEGLLTTAPEQALPGIQTAIDSLTAGMNGALETLTAPAATTLESGSVTTVSDATATARALEAVESGTLRAETALSEALAVAGEESQAAISDAIARITAARERVLASLTGTNISSLTERSALPARPDRPAVPDRPERVQAPERPERPERPVRPELPERPTRPDGG